MNANYRFILASGSPRRKQLLTDAGYEFEVIVPDDSAESGSCSNCSPAELVAELAFRKAANVANQVNDCLILAADTVAECGGQILGKPRDVDHAEQMLRLMSGQKHRVLTGVCLWHQGTDRKLLEVETTTLFMEKMTDDVLQQYLESDQWIGKAGAFGYQDGLDWVRIIEGSESNVVGLPMDRLATMLKKIEDNESQ